MKGSSISVGLQNISPGFTAVNCSGNESSLRGCAKIMTGLEQDCDTASVVCQGIGLRSTTSEVFLTTLSLTVFPELGLDPSNCSDGDLRLLNGSTTLEGRLEICINKAWGTVCSTKFDSSEARVACNKLGLLMEPYSEC